MSQQSFPQQISKYLTELLIIIIGVSISFVVSEYSNYRKEQHALKQMVENIASELKSDSLQLSEKIKSLERLMKWNKTIIQSEDPLLLGDSLLIFIASGPNYAPFLGGTHNAYDYFREVGGFKMLKDDALIHELMVIYNEDYPKIDFIERNEERFIHEQLMTYHIQELPFLKYSQLDEYSDAALQKLQQALSSDAFMHISSVNLSMKHQDLQFSKTCLSHISSTLERIRRYQQKK